MEETEIQSFYSNSRPSVVPSQESAANALPFRAGVLTQRTGHFAQVIKHGSSQGLIAGVVQEAADVGSCKCRENPDRKPIRLKSPLDGSSQNAITTERLIERRVSDAVTINAGRISK